MLYNSLKNKNFILIVVAAVAVISIISAVISQHNQQRLQVYNESDQVMEVPEKEEEKETYEKQVFVNSDLGISLSVPGDWQQVTKDGYPTYIHKPTGASMQIQTFDYVPDVNNITAETASQQVVENNMTFTKFIRKGAANYEMFYRDMGTSTYDYAEEVYWNRANIVKLVFTCEDQYYEKLSSYFNDTVESFVWESDDNIPDGYAVSYIEDAGFEVYVPIDWGSGISGNAFVAQDAESGASMTIQMMQNENYLDGLTAMDFSSLVSQGRQNLIFGNYTSSHEVAEASSTYIIDDAQWQNRAHITADGTNWYLVSIDYIDGMIDDTLPETIFNSFKSYPKENQENAVAEPEQYAYDQTVNPYETPEQGSYNDANSENYEQENPDISGLKRMESQNMIGEDVISELQKGG